MVVKETNNKDIISLFNFDHRVEFFFPKFVGGFKSFREDVKGIFNIFHSLFDNIHHCEILSFYNIEDNHDKVYYLVYVRGRIKGVWDEVDQLYSFWGRNGTALTQSLLAEGYNTVTNKVRAVTQNKLNKGYCRNDKIDGIFKEYFKGDKERDFNTKCMEYVENML